MESILEIAAEVVRSHDSDYGDPVDSFRDIAKGWSIILGQPVRPDEVGLMMIWLKVCRQMAQPKTDNLVDIVGYVECLSRLSSSGERKSDV